MFTIREREERDAAGIGRVRIDAWRAAYRGIVPDEVLANLDYAAEAERHRQRFHETRGQANHFFYVAVDAAESVVGFGVGGSERDGLPGYPGELYALYVHPDWQSRGVGRALAAAVFADLHAAGLEPLVIWALKENTRAGAFYRRLGGEVVAEKQITIGGKVLAEVGFGMGTSGNSEQGRGRE
jgi:ribosomal protein S18 acetylase RimI-like enzyme